MEIGDTSKYWTDGVDLAVVQRGIVQISGRKSIVLEQEFDEEELLQDADYIDDTIREYREMREGKFYEFGSMIVYCLENYFQREVLQE